MGYGEGMGASQGNVRAVGKSKRMGIPALPMPLAVLCCILNFIVPGLGTIIGGFCVCCCARTEDMTCCEKFGSCSASLAIGLLQLVTVPILLLGWIWSCIWGVMFIGMSKEYYHNNPVYTQSPEQDSAARQPVATGPHPGGGMPQYGTPGPQYGQPGVNFQHPGQQYGQPQAQYGPPAAPYGPPAGPAYGSPGAPYGQPAPQGYPMNPNPPQPPPVQPPSYQGRPEPTAPLEPPPPYSEK